MFDEITKKKSNHSLRLIGIALLLITVLGAWFISDSTDTTKESDQKNTNIRVRTHAQPSAHQTLANGPAHTGASEDTGLLLRDTGHPLDMDPTDFITGGKPLSPTQIQEGMTAIRIMCSRVQVNDGALTTDEMLAFLPQFKEMLTNLVRMYPNDAHFLTDANSPCRAIMR